MKSATLQWPRGHQGQSTLEEKPVQWVSFHHQQDTLTCEICYLTVAQRASRPINIRGKTSAIRRMSTTRTDSQENRHIPLAHISPHSSILNRARQRGLRANARLSQPQLPANPGASAQIQACLEVDFHPEFEIKL